MIPIENDEGDLEVGMYEVLLFDLQETTDYRVESLGVESSTFTLDVIELPYVERLELEYHFPPYTGLEPRLVEKHRSYFPRLPIDDLNVLIVDEIGKTVTLTAASVA